jgi:acetyl esterase/lipase
MAVTMRRDRWFRAALPLACALMSALSGCTAVSFGFANLPSYFSGIRRNAGLPYGTDARQRLDVYRPRTICADCPVIVFWYGGSWDNGARQQYRFVGVALAQLGYLTVIPDYRVYPQVRFPLFLEDGAQAVAWVERHAAEYGGNAQRIVLMGHSAGAHMAAMLALNRSYLDHAGADPARIIGLIGLAGPYGLVPNNARLNDIFHAPFTPRDWQVIGYVRSHAPPALLLQGRADKLVAVSNTEELAATLRAHSDSVQTVFYDHRGHVDLLAALSLPARSRAPVLRDVAVFMHRVSADGGNSAPFDAAPTVPIDRP